MNVISSNYKIHESHLFAYNVDDFRDLGASWVLEIVSALRWSWEWNRVKFDKPTEWNFKRDCEGVCMVIRDERGRIIGLRRFYHAPEYFDGEVTFTLDHGVIS